MLLQKVWMHGSWRLFRIVILSINFSRSCRSKFRSWIFYLSRLINSHHQRWWDCFCRFRRCDNMVIFWEPLLDRSFGAIYCPISHTYEKEATLIIVASDILLIDTPAYPFQTKLRCILLKERLNHSNDWAKEIVSMKSQWTQANLFQLEEVQQFFVVYSPHSYT